METWNENTPTNHKTNIAILQNLQCVGKVKEPEELTYKGPNSHLWAMGANTNHNIIMAQDFRLMEKIAIKSISTSNKKQLSESTYFIEKRKQ